MIEMTNFEEFVYEALSNRAEVYDDDDKVNCLLNHYEKTIGLYVDMVRENCIPSAMNIVDNDYYKLNLICFDADEEVDDSKIDEVMDYYTYGKDEIYLKQDDELGKTYLYSFKLPINRDFDKKNLIKSYEVDAEEMEF